VPSDTTAGRRQQETRTCGTTRAEREPLGDWLRSWGVTKIGMEATSTYWKPVFFLLESPGFDCQLSNAAQVKALPGRLARGTMRGKIRRLEQALDCSFFTAGHAAVLAMMLATIDHYTAQIEALTARIEAIIEPWMHPVDQLDAVHGTGPVCAQDIIAEIGTTMTAFPTAAHPVSWARRSPQVKQSTGRRTGSNATGRGTPYLSAALGEAAAGAGRTQSFLGARYRRMVRRMPTKKALVATGNSMPTIVHALLADPQASHQDLGADYHEQRMHTPRQARNHVRSPERPGFKVTIQAPNPGTGELLAPAG
jgi:transposase